MHNDAAMRKREGESNVAAVGSARDEREQTALEIGCVPVDNCSFEDESGLWSADMFTFSYSFNTRIRGRLIAGKA